MFFIVIAFSCQDKSITSQKLSSKDSTDTLLKNKNKSKKAFGKKEIIFERALNRNKNIYLNYCVDSTIHHNLNLYDSPDFLKDEQDNSIYGFLDSYFRLYVDTLTIRKHSSKGYKAFVIEGSFRTAKRITKNNNYFIISGEIGDNPKYRNRLSSVLSLVIKVPKNSTINFEPSKPPSMELVQEIYGVIIGYLYEKDDPLIQRHLLWSRELPLAPHTLEGFENYSNELGIMRWEGDHYGEVIELTRDGVPIDSFLQDAYNLLQQSE